MMNSRCKNFAKLLWSIRFCRRRFEIDYSKSRLDKLCNIFFCFFVALVLQFFLSIQSCFNHNNDNIIRFCLYQLIVTNRSNLFTSIDCNKSINVLLTNAIDLLLQLHHRWLVDNLTFAVNSSSVIIIKNIVVLNFQLDVFQQTNHRYVVKYYFDEIKKTIQLIVINNIRSIFVKQLNLVDFVKKIKNNSTNSSIYSIEWVIDKSLLRANFRQFQKLTILYRATFDTIRNSTINSFSIEITSKKSITSNKRETIDFFTSRLITRVRDDIDDTFVTRNQSTTIRFFFAFVFTFNVSSITQSNSFIIFEFVLRSIFSIKVIIDTFDISTKKIIYSQSIKSKLSQSQQSSNQQNQN